MAPSHQAQSTIHSLAEVKPLGGGNRQEPPGSCQRPTTPLQSKTGFQLASRGSWLYLPSVEQFSDFIVEIFTPHIELIALFTQLYFYNEIINFWGKSQAFQSLLHKTQKITVCDCSLVAFKFSGNELSICR